ncbi:MAG: protein disulfide oxidoreductase [Candidatus Thiodiazotropha sp. (ex Ctena orbiculata)]|nr:protein disulfide oxidoreductase [Candidatus Thiodiazotropha taylori]
MKHENSVKPPLTRRLLSWGFQLAGLLLVLFLIHLWQTRDLVAGVAPPLSANSLEGLPVDLESFGNEPVVVHFWATWCPVCKLEASAIEQLAEDHKVVTVAMQSGPAAEVSDYLEANDLGFTTINDPQGRLSSAWRVRGLPTSYIIDENRQVRFVSVGYTPEFTLRLRLWLLDHIL